MNEVLSNSVVVYYKVVKIVPFVACCYLWSDSGLMFRCKSLRIGSWSGKVCV